MVMLLLEMLAAPETMLKVIGNPDDALAPAANRTSPYVLFRNAPKVMVWLPCATLKFELTAPVKPLAVAVNCLLPAESISRLVNVTVPLPAEVPMSRFVAPFSAPVPDDNASPTFKLPGRPEAELFPN